MSCSHPDTATSEQCAAKLPWLWAALEFWFETRYRVEPVGGDPTALIGYNTWTYAGPELALEDEAVVRKGDRIMEVHFRRPAVIALTRPGDPARTALNLMKQADRDFPRLADLLEQESFEQVKALHALSLFHVATRRYGFEVQPVRPKHLEWWFTAWQRLILTRDHPAAREARVTAERLVVRHAWQSRERLIRRYGGKAPRGESPAAAASR